MKGDLCRQCRTGVVESRKGDYCPTCLKEIQRSGLNGRKAFAGYWYQHQKVVVK